jgi:hypothetical protein
MTKPEKKPRGDADKFVTARELVRPYVLAGEKLPSGQLVRENGLSPDTYERAAFAEQGRKEAFEELGVDPATLSMTAQQKLDVAIKQATNTLEAQFEQRCNDRVTRMLKQQLAYYNEKCDQYQQVIELRNGVMPRTTFNKIRMALHPDTYQNASRDERNELVQTWEEVKWLMLSEAEHPTSTKVAGSVEELRERMEQYRAEQRAARAARKAGKTKVSRTA